MLGLHSFRFISALILVALYYSIVTSCIALGKCGSQSSRKQWQQMNWMEKVGLALVILASFSRHHRASSIPAKWSGATPTRLKQWTLSNLLLLPDKWRTKCAVYFFLFPFFLLLSKSIAALWGSSVALALALAFEGVLLVAYFGALFLSLQHVAAAVAVIFVAAAPAVPHYCAMFRNAALFQQNAP